MISYKRLWITLAEKGLKKKDLQEKVKISSATFAKFGKNEPVNLSVIQKICNALDCNLEDVVEVTPDVSAENKRKRVTPI